MPSFGINAAAGLASNLLGVRLDPYQSHNFLVEVEGILVGSFSECSGLQVETETTPYREGGLNEYEHRFAGPTKYPSLILKHGLTQLFGLWSWHQDVAKGQVERRNGTIYLLDKQAIPVIWWNFTDAFPVKWTGPDFRAGSAEVAFESVELVHRGLSRPALAALAAGIGAATAKLL
ncbi:MAG: phage tail protein [Nitrospira sp.]|nr:phage tail protein [Nitrospira sp.]